MGKVKSKGVYFMMPEDRLEKLKDYAHEFYMSQSSFIRYCIDKEMSRLDREYKSDENPAMEL